MAEKVIIVKRFLQRLFLFEKFDIKTSLTKEKILNKVETFLCVESEDYYGRLWEDGFYVAERSRRNFGLLWRSRNSFAPVAKAKITENDTGCTVTITIRMNMIVMVLFWPLWILSIPSIFLTETYGLMFIILLVALILGFFIPAKILREYLVDMLDVR